MDKSTEQKPPEKSNVNSNLSAGQLNLGLLVDNPTDDLFEGQEVTELNNNINKTTSSSSSSNSNVIDSDTIDSFQVPKNNNYNAIDKDELESLHGDSAIVMDDKRDRNDRFDTRSVHSTYSRNSNHSRKEEESDERKNERRKLYHNIKTFCKKKNIEIPSHINSDSPYHELKSHDALLRSDYKMDKSVQMCKKVLVGVSSVFEYLNTRFDPIGLKIDGFSENINDTKDEYDEVFEELYLKYEEKISTPPEVRLIMMFGGSLASYHILNTMTKKMKESDVPEQKVYSSSSAFRMPDQSPNNPVNIRKISNPKNDENKDIQDILKEIEKESKQETESVGTSTSTIRRKRGKKSIGLDEL